MCLIGVISDTHGLLRPEAVRSLRHCRRIIHAGDAGKPAILAELNRLAPTVAVRGNVDVGDWALSLPTSQTFDINGSIIHVLHDLHALKDQPAPAGTSIVISGHSHQPRIENEAGILYINPGSAGPRRFRLPVTLAYLEVAANSQPWARLINLLEL